MNDLIRFSTLTPSAKALLAYMGDVTYASAEVLAGFLQLDRRTVFAAIDELCTHGLITRDAKMGRGGYVTLARTPECRDRLRAMCGPVGKPDGVPGAEYTTPTDPDAAQADRARLMADKSWRLRTRWAR